MKLKEFLKLHEMSLPVFRTPEQAAQEIEDIYASVVKKGESAMGKRGPGDYLGRLDAALQSIQKSTSPERWSSSIKKGLAAKKALGQHREKFSKAQVMHTAVG